jgi:hypothetical protein
MNHEWLRRLTVAVDRVIKTEYKRAEMWKQINKETIEACVTFSVHIYIICKSN